MSMLEYTKTVLGKMSFDTTLFRKEWGKSLQWLIPKEVRDLENWVHRQFNAQWQPIPVKASRRWRGR